MRKQVKMLEHHSHPLFVQIHFFSCQVRTVKEIDIWPSVGTSRRFRNAGRWISTSGRTYDNDYLTFFGSLVHPFKACRPPGNTFQIFRVGSGPLSFVSGHCCAASLSEYLHQFGEDRHHDKINQRYCEQREKCTESTASDDIAALRQILQSNITGNGGLF